MENALEKFPVSTVLSDGRRCLIRPIEPEDKRAFQEFHAAIPDREQLFVMNQIKDGSLFRKWIADPGFGKDLPLLALVDGRLVAIGSLHQRLGGWKRHIGKVFFLTHPDFRGLGLVDRLLEEIIEVSRHAGLTKLESEINGERKAAIQSLAAAGFAELLRIPNYIQDMQAEHHDYVLMGMELVASFEDLGAGD